MYACSSQIWQVRFSLPLSLVRCDTGLPTSRIVCDWQLVKQKLVFTTHGSCLRPDVVCKAACRWLADGSAGHIVHGHCSLNLTVTTCHGYKICHCNITLLQGLQRDGLCARRPGACSASHEHAFNYHGQIKPCHAPSSTTNLRCLSHLALPGDSSKSSVGCCNRNGQ